MLLLRHCVRQLFDGSAKRLPVSYLNNNMRSYGSRHTCLPDERFRKMSNRRSRSIGQDNAQIRISKTIAHLLRHDNTGSRLMMRKDGYVAVADLLNHHQLRDVDVFVLEKIVNDDPKKRFHLLYESQAHHVPGSSSQTNVWWIRANQGHSLKGIELDLKEISSPTQVKMAVHGTTSRAWKSISKTGLSVMERNHIHLAQGVGGADIISGMRSSSQVLIFINLEKALAAGIKFYLSSNGVVLTPGNEQGLLEPQFFERVERITVKKDQLLGESPQADSESVSNPETLLDSPIDLALTTSERPASNSL